MFPLIQFLKFTVTGALIVPLIFSTSASATEMVQNLGPVKAHEGLLAEVGNMRVIAFFEPSSGSCAVNAVLWDTLGADPGESAKRVQVRIGPGEVINIETARQESLKLQCGKDAENLAIIDIEGLSASGITAQPPGTTR
jgi:hypothetical protein